MKPFFEFGLMVGVIVAFGLHFCPSDPLLLKVHPHPFWAVTLLMALRYGTTAGLLSGLVCAAAQLYCLTILGLRLSEGFHLGASELISPLLYAVVGGVVGESVQKRMRRADFYVGQNDVARKRLAAKETEITALTHAYNLIEGQIAGQADTIIALYDSARLLDSDDPDEVYRGLLTILRERLGVESCGIWAVESGGSLRRIFPEGEPDAPAPELALAALRKDAVVNARDLFSEDGARPEDGLLAGPLRRSDARAFAVVVVDKMRFVGLTHVTLRVFGLLLDWASRSLARSAGMADLRGLTPAGVTRDVERESAFRSRAQREITLAELRGMPASLLVCRLAGEMPDATRAGLRVAIGRVFRRMLRLSDRLTWLDEEAAFVMLLAEVGRDGARIVWEKLERVVAEFGFQPCEPGRRLVIEWGVAECAGGEDVDGALQRALSSLEKAPC